MQHGGGGHIGLRFYRNFSAADNPILTKFGVPTQILTPPSNIYPKFEFLKIQDGGRNHLENIRNVITSRNIDRFAQNLVCGHILSS